MRPYFLSSTTAALLFLLLQHHPLEAQAAGSVVGRVMDAETGQPLAGAQISVVGTPLGAISAVGGRYTILRVPAGTYSLRVVFIGYGEKTVEGVVAPASGVVVQDVSLVSAAIALEGITVTTVSERGSVTTALNEQRSAIGVTSATTLDQITRSPDSDAAQAVQRVSGVTVRDGRYVFVRGLGERYTTASLNGARLPSPEPEKKVVPLDLFPSNLLDGITTTKTFTPNQPGDFSGAQVNLRTRSFPGQRLIQLSASGGLNFAAAGQEIPMPNAFGGEWLGMAAGNRQLPTELTRITDFSGLSQGDVNRLIRALPRTWSFDNATGQPNASAGLTIGGEDLLLGQRLGYVGSLSYSRNQEVHENEIRSRAVPGDAAGTPVPYNVFKGSTGQTSILWGGLLNLSTYLGASTKIDLNNTYDRTADNVAHVDWGTLEEFQQVDSVRRSLSRYVERTVRSNQLRAEHQLGARNNVSWMLTSSNVSRSEPDRTDLAYGYELAPSGQRLPLSWLGFIPEAAKRTVGDLNENVWSGDLDYKISLGAAESQTVVRLGGSYRHTVRDSYATSYNLRAVGLSASQRAASPDELFYGAYTVGDASGITLEPNSSGGSYGATDGVSAGYLMAEMPLGTKVRVIGGARVEQWDLSMEVEPTTSALMHLARRNTDVLPSIALNARLTENQTLRLSASRTLARPEYRELAPVSYRDMLGEREVFGDSSLVRTLIQNYDVRWEWYPQLDEVVSVGFFAKRFDHPIEQIDVATSGASQLSFINAESASNYGVELELRKGMGFLATGFQPFSLFANATLMRSRIDTGNSNLSALTNDERPMVGQSPYVVNTGLSYVRDENDLSATLLYNVAGRRISSAAVTPLRVDTYELSRHQIDFSIRFPLVREMSGKLDLKNLLNSSYEERQGDVVRYRYNSGRSITLGASWKLQ